MTTTWLVGLSGSDANGGTSKTIRSSGVDGIVNTTAGLTKITSATASWSSGDVGHGLCATGVFRLVSAFTAGGTVASCTTQSSTTVLSANFTTAMIGQGISGTDIPADTVITAVSAGVSATISNTASGSHGSLTLTLSPMLTTTGNVAMVAGTGKSWVVGGMWASWTSSLLATNSPIGNGDTIYVGPGIYREQPTANLTNPTATVNIIGDVDGVQTGGTPGEVRLSSFNQTGFAAPSSSSTINLNSKNFLSFSNIVFVASGVNSIFNSPGHDYTFTDCALWGGGIMASKTATVDTALNWTFDRCYAVLNGGVCQVTAPTSTIADYDLNIMFRNGFILNFSSTTSFFINASGSNSFKGGGIHVRSTTAFVGPSTFFTTSGANVSTNIPCTIRDCFIMGYQSGLLASSVVGQILEDYNVLNAGSSIRSNVTAGFHSTGSTSLSIETLFHFGQERIWGGALRPFGTPTLDSPMMGWGSAGTSGSDAAPTVDLLNRARPAGQTKILASGTLTAGGTASATDSGASFGGSGQIAGATLAITGGTGSGQEQMIKSHTPTVLTVYGNWNTQPDNTSTYMIYYGAPASVGKATTGSPTTLTQSNATWDTNMWQGFSLSIVSGTGSGQTTTVVSNTGTGLTVPSFGTNPDSTSVYKLYRKTSEVTANATAGAFERHDTAGKETVLTNSGSVAWNLYGSGDQTLMIPVDTTSTTITVKCSFDTAHGNTNKPQAMLVADGELGITGQTLTATGTAGSGTFETLSFTPVAASKKGFVTVRLQARSDSVQGRAIFDTVAVV